MAIQVSNDKDIVKGRPFVRRYRWVPKTPIKQAIRPCEKQVHVTHHPVGLPATESDLAAIIGPIPRLLQLLETL